MAVSLIIKIFLLAKKPPCSFARNAKVQGGRFDSLLQEKRALEMSQIFFELVKERQRKREGLPNVELLRGFLCSGQQGFVGAIESGFIQLGGGALIKAIVSPGELVLEVFGGIKPVFGGALQEAEHLQIIALGQEKAFIGAGSCTALEHIDPIEGHVAEIT